jgi:hypothetical protein
VKTSYGTNNLHNLVIHVIILNATQIILQII